MTGESPILLRLLFMDFTCVCRSECSQWVLGVQGSVFNKVRSWNKAMSLYNSRLAKGVCEVLS